MAPNQLVPQNSCLGDTPALNHDPRIGSNRIPHRITDLTPHPRKPLDGHLPADIVPNFDHFENNLDIRYGPERPNNFLINVRGIDG